MKELSPSTITRIRHYHNKRFPIRDIARILNLTTPQVVSIVGRAYGNRQLDDARQALLNKPPAKYRRRLTEWRELVEANFGSRSEV